MGKPLEAAEVPSAGRARPCGIWNAPGFDASTWDAPCLSPEVPVIPPFVGDVFGGRIWTTDPGFAWRPGDINKGTYLPDLFGGPCVVVVGK